MVQLRQACTVHSCQSLSHHMNDIHKYICIYKCIQPLYCGKKNINCIVLLIIILWIIIILSFLYIIIIIYTIIIYHYVNTVIIILSSSSRHNFNALHILLIIDGSSPSLIAYADQKLYLFADWILPQSYRK